MKQKLLGLLLAFTACFITLPTTHAQNTKDIIDRLETALGVSLPSPYRTKFKEFVATNKIMCDEGSNAFTEQFIKDQMKNNLGINRQNQFLLVWNAIYHAIKKDYIYDGSDGNEAILDDYSKVMNEIDACEAKYRNDYISYTKQISAEARRQSAEARRQSAEARRQSAEARRQSAEARQQSAELDQSIVISTYSGICHLISYYSLWKVAPESAKIESELNEAKENCKYVINNCHKYNINYQSLLPVEVQNFYGIDPVQQNSLTCEKAEVKTLNIVLQEIVKLYNIYQKAPQAKREIHDIKDYIEACKKHNIDYKSKLSPEVRKFFGIE